MQTFLPFPSYEDSAWALDPQRLGNQRNETLIIARSLLTGKGWPHHAVTRMWSRNVAGLLAYGLVVCQVWQTRNGATADTVGPQMRALAHEVGLNGSVEYDLPEWFGVEEFHRSHRSNLLRKDYEFTVRPRGWYREQGWAEPADLPYWYPPHHGYEWDAPPVELPYALGLR